MKENGMRMRADTEDFMRSFENNMAKTSTYRAAYELTEKEHEKLTGHRRYAHFDSFANIRYRRMKKKK